MIIRFICGIVMSCALLESTSPIAAQEMQVQKTPISSNPASGEELFRKHCAACHGNDLRGSGPFPSPYRTPPDLTRLARRHGGKFPEVYVLNVLRNGVVMPAH